MIKNENELNYYTSRNKVYIPTLYNNSDFTYRISNDVISIITNQNCYDQYNSRYCDCYSYYYDLDLITDKYSCNINSNSSNLINYNSITSDINFSQKVQSEYTYDKIIMFGIIIIAFLFFISLKKGYRYL